MKLKPICCSEYIPSYFIYELLLTEGPEKLQIGTHVRPGDVSTSWVESLVLTHPYKSCCGHDVSEKQDCFCHEHT